MAHRLFSAKSAVGGVGSASSSVAACASAEMSQSRRRDSAVGVTARAPLESRQAFHYREEVGPRADETDPAMAVREQVGGRGEGAAAVVGEHRVGREPGGGSVDEHHGQPRRLLREQVALVVAGRHDDDTVDASRGQRPQGGLRLGSPGGRRQHQRAVLRGHLSMPRITPSKNRVDVCFAMTPIVSVASWRRRLRASSLRRNPIS